MQGSTLRHWNSEAPARLIYAAAAAAAAAACLNV